MTLDNGLTLTALAHSMMRVYAAGVAADEPEADDLMALVLAEETGNGWVAAAGLVVGEYHASEQAEVRLAVSDLTRRAFDEFNRGAELPTLAFDLLAPRGKLAWEAATRHVAGAVACDEGDAANLLSGESMWRPWLRQTAANRGIDLG